MQFMSQVVEREAKILQNTDSHAWQMWGAACSRKLTYFIYDHGESIEMEAIDQMRKNEYPEHWRGAAIVSTLNVSP